MLCLRADTADTASSLTTRHKNNNGDADADADLYQDFYPSPPSPLAAALILPFNTIGDSIYRCISKGRLRKGGWMSRLSHPDLCSCVGGAYNQRSSSPTGQASRKMAVRPTTIAIAVSVVAVSFIFLQYTNKLSRSQPKLWTTEELTIYNGTDPQLPILLSILGSVFDVTKGKSHYGPGGSYNHFAGRDASRAFVSGNFTGDGLVDSLHGLSSVEVKSIVDWRDFYFRSYIFTGHLVGRYYDVQGHKTKYLKGVEAKAARGAQLLEKQKNEEAKIPSCNSKWSQQEGGEVWCDVGYPRLVQRPLEIALTGKMSRRCACFEEEQLSDPGLEVYSGCDHLSKVCAV